MLSCVLQSLQPPRHIVPSDSIERSYNVIHGLHSYDIHLNHEYRRAFGLDSVVPDKFLRGLPGHEIKTTSSASASVFDFHSPATGTHDRRQR